MAPKLYMILYSPPVRAILMVAKFIDLKLENVNVKLIEGELLKEEFLKLNPQHTVPTLVDDDGFIIYDSHAILGYLIAKYAPNDALYPKNDIKKRATIDQKLHFDSSILFTRGFVVSRSIVLEGVKEITPKSAEGIRDAYDILERMLEGKKYIAGDELSIADFSIVTSATSWDVLVPIDAKKCPNITGYIKRMECLPCYDENKKGLEAYRTMITSMLA